MDACGANEQHSYKEQNQQWKIMMLVKWCNLWMKRMMRRIVQSTTGSINSKKNRKDGDGSESDEEKSTEKKQMIEWSISRGGPTGYARWAMAYPAGPSHIEPIVIKNRLKKDYKPGILGA